MACTNVAKRSVQISKQLHSNGADIAQMPVWLDGSMQYSTTFQQNGKQCQTAHICGSVSSCCSFPRCVQRFETQMVMVMACFLVPLRCSQSQESRIPSRVYNFCWEFDLFCIRTGCIGTWAVVTYDVINKIK